MPKMSQFAAAGVIDGNAAAFPNAGSICRPMLLRVLRCRNVRVQNLRLLNAAAWGNGVSG